MNEPRDVDREGKDRLLRACNPLLVEARHQGVAESGKLVVHFHRGQVLKVEAHIALATHERPRRSGGRIT